MLEAVELHNGGRAGLNFKELCDKLPWLFGAKGTKTREDFQKDWNTIKKRTFTDYVALLEQLEVTPGTHTTRAVKANLDERTMEQVSGSFRSMNIKSEDTQDLKSEGTDDSSDFVVSPPPTKRTPSLHTPPRIRTPPRSKGGSMTKVGFGSRASTRTPPHVKTLAEYDSEALEEDLGSNNGMESRQGSKTNPFVFSFKSYPNGHPYGFFVRIKHNKKVGRAARSVIEILKSVGADGDEWKAEVVVEGDNAYRSILFSGPSIDWWMMSYLKSLDDDLDDPNNKIDTLGFLQEYKNSDMDAKINYYLMKVEDDELYFDNHAISHDETTILRKFKRQDAKPPLFKGLEVANVMALWEVVIYDKKPKLIIDEMNGSAADLF